MQTVHFLGKILPSTAYQISMHDLPGLSYTPADESFTVSFSITVKNSAVDVECTANILTDDSMIQIHKVAYDYARAAVNFFAFSSGISLFVVFDELVDSTGTRSALVIQDKNLASICTAFSMNDTNTPTSLSRAMNIVFTEPALCWLWTT